MLIPLNAMTRPALQPGCPGSRQARFPVNPCSLIRRPVARAGSRALVAALALTAPLAAGAQPSAPGFAPSPAAVVEELVNGAALACSTALAQRFGVATARVDVWLTPGQRIAIEDGAIRAGDVRRDGLQFGWMLRDHAAPAPIGLCRTGGNGRVEAIEEQKD